MPALPIVTSFGGSTLVMPLLAHSLPSLPATILVQEAGKVPEKAQWEKRGTRSMDAYDWKSLQ
jgi:hypothetical protein